MSIEVRLPYLGDVGEIKVVSVLKGPGDRVEAKEPLLEVEAEKTVYVIEAPNGGVVERVLVSEGQKVSPGDLLMLIRSE